MSEFDPSNLNYEFKDFIGIYENAFTKKECDDVISLFEKFDKLGYTHKRKVSGMNQNHSSSFDLIDFDWSEDIIQFYHERFYNCLYPLYNHQYSVLQTIQSHRSRHIKIQKTLPCQGYHVWHCESNSSQDIRVLSWILYLNDIEEGGETEFLYQSLRIKPKTGTFILFPAYFTHTHRGNPPLKREKYIATGWIEYVSSPEQQGIANLPDLSKRKSGNSVKYN